MNQNLNIFTRICWYDLEKNIVCSRWYRGTAAIEQAKAACNARWPQLTFWIERGRSSSHPELTIQDLLG